MKLFLRLLILILIAISCKSRKVEKSVEQKTELRKKEVTTETESKKAIVSERLENKEVKNEVVNYDFELKSNDAFKPAVIKEYRQGKPYRTIIATNAVYNENRKKKQQYNKQLTKDYSIELTKVFKAFLVQKMEINELKIENEQLKSDTLKIANNIKYILWFLGLLSVIWIGERTGFFRLLKKFLNGL